MATALAGLGLDPGVDVEALWRASDLVDEHIGDEPVTPLAPRIAVRAAEHQLPTGLVAALDAQLRALGLGRPDRRGARGTRPHPRGGRLASARRADRPDPRLPGAPARALFRALPDRGGRAQGAAGRQLREPAGTDRPRREARGRARLRRHARGGAAGGAGLAQGRGRGPGSKRGGAARCWRSSAKRPSRCCSRSAAVPIATRASPPAVSTRRGQSAFARSFASSRNPASVR